MNGKHKNDIFGARSSGNYNKLIYSTTNSSKANSSLEQSEKLSDGKPGYLERGNTILLNLLCLVS